MFYELRVYNSVTLKAIATLSSALNTRCQGNSYIQTERVAANASHRISVHVVCILFSLFQATVQTTNTEKQQLIIFRNSKFMKQKEKSG